MGLAPLDLFEADGDVERIDVVFVLEQHQVLVKYIGIFELVAVQQVEHASGLVGDTLQGVVSQTLLPRAQTSGRVLASEVLVHTPAVANLVREGQVPQLYSVMQASSSLGMHTLDQSLSELVAAGLVSRQVAQGYLVDPRALDKVRVRPQDLDADAWAQHAAVQQGARRAS